MTEDETECKLTYKEGKKIAAKAEKPYTSAMLASMTIFVFLTGMILLFQWLDGIPMHPITESMSYFVDSGEISQELAWYLRKSYDGAIIIGGLFGMASTLFLTISLSSEARKKALKEANEEKVERCRDRGGSSTGRRSWSTPRRSATSWTRSR